MSYHTEDLHYHFSIRVRAPYGLPFTYKVWTKMSWAVRTKWSWYFEYRAALYKVQNPRHEVTTQWGHKLKITKEEYELRQLKRGVVSQKALVTKYSNRIEAYRAAWRSLFPIEEDSAYIKALDKIDLAKAKLRKAELDLQIYIAK